MTNPDLPGEQASFVPAASEVVVQVGDRYAIANVIPKSIEEQQAIHHNVLRYAELQKLRRGHPNLYNETSYL